MSSTPTGRAPVLQPIDILDAPFGKAPDVSLHVAYDPAFDLHRPGAGELALAFRMFDELLRDTPFDQWEH